MKIGKICQLILLSLFLGIGFSNGYQGEGFYQYQEGADGISFGCIDKCFITIGGENKIDYFYLSGVVNGSGTIGYGPYNGSEISLLDRYNFTTGFNISNFTDLIAYNKQFNSADLKLLLSGNVQGNLYLQAGNLSFLQKFNLVWRDFRRMEPFKQYSMNQRYGIFLRGVSIIKCGYIIFFLVSLFILLFIKDKFKLIFYVGLCLFLFIGIRNLITYTFIINEGLNEFKINKNFFELGDYFLFVDKVRSKLNLDSKENKINDCKILLEYGKNFKHGPLDIYFKPCELASTGDLVNYKIYYKKEISSDDLDKKVLIDFKGSYLLKNK